MSKLTSSSPPSLAQSCPPHRVQPLVILFVPAIFFLEPGAASKLPHVAPRLFPVAFPLQSGPQMPSLYIINIMTKETQKVIVDDIKNECINV